MPANPGTMKTVVFGICLLISFTALAQRDCATQVYLQEQQTAHPSLSNRVNDVEAFIQRQKSNARLNGTSAATILKIPVVVHVVYATAAQNISDAQVKSQIDALNRDFRRQNFDTVNTPQRFKNVAADVQIEFALATADPKGRPTNGIVRRQTSFAYWKSDDKIKHTLQGGDDAWDSRYYLNIWVGNLQSSLGYSTLPGGSAEVDGVVIAASAFGTVNVGGNYNLGRTAVHEIGHWLGLKHIWGDYYCGDDLVDDTPKQGNFTPGCPTGFRSSCSNGTTGDMYMNYMDYTGDACLNLFTEGQKARMRSLFNEGGPRNSLLYSKGLNQPWVAAAPAEAMPVTASKLYPNPATDELVLNLGEAWIGSKVQLTNANGAVLATLTITSKTQKIDISGLKAAMYFVHGESGATKLREKFVKL